MQCLFQRTAFPGLTVIGRIETRDEVVDINTASSKWEAQIDESIQFPMGLVDDPFLHVCLHLFLLRDTNQEDQRTHLSKHPVFASNSGSIRHQDSKR